MGKWTQSTYPGVRFREHPSRLFRRKPDQYFAIRYRTADHVRHENGLGWASAGWTEKLAYDALCTLERNITEGRGPQTLDEMRGQLASERAEAERQEERKRISAMTFSDLAKAYIKAKAKKKSIGDDEQRLRDHVEIIIGDLPLSEVHQGHIRAIQARLEDMGRAPATIKQCVILVRALYNFAAKTPANPDRPADGPLYDGKNPFSGYADVPKFANSRQFWFTEEQARDVLEAVAEMDARRRLNGEFVDFVRLAMFTGMRRGEIASLRKCDVIPSINSIVMRSDEEKNSEGRVVYVPDELMDSLRKRLDGNGEDPLFTLVSRDDASHYFKDIMEQMGLRSKNRRTSACFHNLRHTILTHLVMDGTALTDVQNISGHKTFEMVRRYVKSAAPQVRRAVSGFHRKMVSAGQSEDRTDHPDDDTPASG